MADSKISALSAVTTVLSTDEYVLARSGATNKITGADLMTAFGGGGGLFDAYALLRDQKTANTAGGTFTSGAWQTRTLNTESFDTGSFVSLSSNQFTLGAGTYLIQARAPGYACGRHKAKIRNITDSTDDVIGASVYSNNTTTSDVDAVVTGRITIAGTKAFELQHRCENTASSNGLGVESNFGVIEVYAEVLIWREA